jgi:ABC-2 type transport system permease protein
MRPILALLRKDLLNFFRSPASVVLTFAVPFFLIYLFGQIFGVNRKDTGPTGIRLAVVNASDNPAAARLVDALRRERAFRILTETTAPDGAKRPLTEADLRPLMQKSGAEFRFALVLPADLIDGTGGIGLRLKFLSNPRNEIETQTVNGLLQKAIFSHVPELLGQSLQAEAQRAIGEARLAQFNGAVAGAVASAFGGDRAEIERRIAAGDFGFAALPAGTGGATAGGTAGAENSAAQDFLAQLVRFETEQVVGAQVRNPVATGMVGGWAIQFLLFALSSSATSLFRERDAGLFQRLLAAPLTRAHLLWSKFLHGVVLGLIQLVALFIAAGTLLGIEVLPHLPLLALVSVFAAAACTSFGMLLAAVSPTPEAANGLATFLILLMCAVGGAWFPLSLLPEFIQQFGRLTLVYWAMEGFSAVLWARQGLLEILPLLGILAGITAAVMTLAIWGFNRGKLFN